MQRHCDTLMLHLVRCRLPVTDNVHYCDVIMGPTASQITSLTSVYSIVYSGTDQRKHQSSASLAFVRGIHRRPVNSPHKWPVTRKMLPFDDVIMVSDICELAPFHANFAWFTSRGHKLCQLGRDNLRPQMIVKNLSCGGISYDRKCLWKIFRWNVSATENANNAFGVAWQQPWSPFTNLD